MMTDEPASNIWDTARFLKLSADMEHDDPEQAPAFKRDQQLTDAALASWCDGDRFRFGEHVERYPHEVHVTVYRD